jgi:hypothetical protein
MSSAAPKPIPSAEDLLEQALQLPKEQRMRLAQQLRESLDSTDPDVQSAWTEEIVTRVETLERGEVELVDAKEVFARVRARHAR